MINSRKLEDLLPVVREKAEAFIAACAKQGITVLIYSTYRDNESQAEIYAQGRTKPGKRVTNAKPGMSYHNWRCAFDFVPTIKGVPQWDDSKLYATCGRIATSVGLDWGGNWKSFPDKPHCQYTGGLKIADLRAGRTIE